MSEQMQSEESQLNLDDLRIGYLSCPVGASNDYLGGLLVIDGHARPKHFAYVDAVKPNRLQRILYSDTLDSATRVDTIARELLGSLSESPCVLFVDDALRGVTRYARCPVAHLRATEKKKGKLKPYTYDIMDDLPDNEAVRTITYSIDDSIDLLEPFDRIRNVLEELENPITKALFSKPPQSQTEPEQ